MAARHRVGLTRRRKSLRLDLTIELYDKLLRLSRGMDGDRPEALVTVVERLIRQANE